MQKPTIIITGANRGLGRELAFQASKNGYPLALVGRTLPELKQLSDELQNQFGFHASVHAVDLTDILKTKIEFMKIAETHESIFSLVNCAATWTGGKSIREISSEFMHESLLLNFFTTFNSIKALLSLPDKTISAPASIINIGATASLRGSKNCSAFAVAKGAIRQLSQSLARELGPENIHVAHLVIDGLINNDRTKKLNNNLGDEKFINASAIAETILHILSQDRSCWTFECDIRPWNETW